MATLSIVYAGTPDAGDCHVDLRMQVKSGANTVYDFTRPGVDRNQIKFQPSDDDVESLLYKLVTTIIARTGQNFSSATAAANYLAGLGISITGA